MSSSGDSFTRPGSSRRSRAMRYDLVRNDLPRRISALTGCRCRRLSTGLRAISNAVSPSRTGMVTLPGRRFSEAVATVDPVSGAAVASVDSSDALAGTRCPRSSGSGFRDNAEIMCRGRFRVNRCRDTIEESDSGKTRGVLRSVYREVGGIQVEAKHTVINGKVIEESGQAYPKRK